MKNPTSPSPALSPIVALAIFLLACTQFSFQASPEREKDILSGLELLLKDLHTHTSMSWKLEQTFDPYQEGSSMRTSAYKGMQIRLYANGSFKEIHSDKIISGNWQINKGEKLLEMRCEMLNGRKVPARSKHSSYQIISYDSEFLVLGRQGRHGVVELKLRRLKHTNRSSYRMIL
ncbi:MAG: hypothetical protein AAF696_21475 [Bacteroidota bacterium]